VNEIKVIMNLLKDFQANVTKPINVYEDNLGAIAIAKFGNFTKNSKRIEVHYHFVHECVEEGMIDIIKIESKNNIADILIVRKEQFREIPNNVKTIVNP